jgi:CBS domain-containing protein
MILAAILKTKGGSVVSVTPASRISDVIKVLAEKRIGAVLVCDEQHQLEGILSERDIVRTLADHASATFDMTAEQLMTRSLKVASPETTVAQAMEMMTDGRFRHLPVLASGKLVGLVSIGDVVPESLRNRRRLLEAALAAG